MERGELETGLYELAEVVQKMLIEEGFGNRAAVEKLREELKIVLSQLSDSECHISLFKRTCYQRRNMPDWEIECELTEYCLGMPHYYYVELTVFIIVDHTKGHTEVRPGKNRARFVRMPDDPEATTGKAKETPPYIHERKLLNPAENEKLLEDILGPRRSAQKESTASPTSSWKRETEWYFTEEERHAFLTALERHWATLLEACEEKEVHIGTYDTWQAIVSYAGRMAPAEVDIFVYHFLVERECEYLAARGENEKLDCGHDARTHHETLSTWRTQNLP